MPDVTSLLLPPGALLLHIGPYKTGSTAIQAAMHRARSEMREHGVVYPGRGSRAMRAGWAVIGVTPRGRPEATIDEWHSLVDEVRAVPELRVCVSTEDLGRVGGDVAHRVVEDLGPDRVHVVTVVRRLDRLLPSQWQQRAQSFKTDGYDEYLHAVLDPGRSRRHASGKAFWQSHDLGRLLDVWSAEVPADRIVAVVADETDRTLLPRTFEALLGLPDGLLQRGPSANPSLSFNAVELVRRLNRLAEERGWPDEVYYRLMRSMVDAMKDAGRSPLDRAVPRLPDWAVDRVAELSDARADALAASGVRVVGDLQSLRKVEPGDGAGAEAVDSIALDTVVQGLGGAVRGYHRLQRRSAQQARRARRAAGGAGRGASRAAAARGDTVATTSSKDLLAVVGRRVAGSVRGRLPARPGDRTKGAADD